MRTYILIFLFFSQVLNGYCQRQMAYTQLVFPKEINQFPLLICNSLNNSLCDYNVLAEKFISEQKDKRSINHKLLSNYAVSDYDSIKYPFVIYPCLLDIKGVFKNGFGNKDDEVLYSEWMSYKIYDRRTDKYYRPYAIFKNKNKDPWDNLDYSYPPRKLSLANPRNYFKDLSKLIATMDKVGSTAAFEKELKRQNRIIKPLHIIVIACVLAPVAIGLAFLL